LGLSVVIPVAKDDRSWLVLLPDLVSLGVDDEVIFVSPTPESQEFRDAIHTSRLSANTTWIQSAPGRARQLNVGALRSKNEFLWFLHCDSRIGSSAIGALNLSLISSSHAVLFFNLKFLGDGPALMAVNRVGAFFRSRVLRLPFGDQGLCVSKEVFERLGKFDETAPYGEDHLFVWRAHQTGVPLVCVGQNLFTSARKYKERGWSTTTFRHVLLTLKQALPQLAVFLRDRGGER